MRAVRNTQALLESLKEKDDSEKLGADVRIVLKYFSRKGLWVWTSFIYE
jgi:hypothetical protein